jgi:hypothetical protein
VDSVAVLNKLDRALIDLLTGDLTADKIIAVAEAWCRRDTASQLALLHYNGEDTTRGRALRAALTVASGTHDLGAIAAEFEWMREQGPGFDVADVEDAHAAENPHARPVPSILREGNCAHHRGAGNVRRGHHA